MSNRAFLAVMVFLCTCSFAVGFWFKWYRAGIQAEVYRRQGVEMSRWEILMGAKPIERSIREAP